MASDMFIVAFAAHINKLRQERNLSFQEMANACEMDKAQVYKLCTSGIDIRASTVIKIAKGLNITIEQLFEI